MRFLFLLLALAFASLRPCMAQRQPPAVLRVLDQDTVAFFGTSEQWHTRFVEVAAVEPLWVEVSDPYGGMVRIPAMFYLDASSHLISLSEQKMRRSVLFIPRAILVPAIGFLLIGFLTAVAFPFAVYRQRLHAERRRRQRLDETRHHLAEGRETERLRLAMDLHDGPIQDLHAIRMRLSLLGHPASSGDGGPPRVSETLGEVVEEVQRVIRGLRDVSEDLRPPSLAPFGLAAAVRAYAERFARMHPGIKVRLDLADDGQSLPEHVRLALFRITQESCSNAAKHAAPTRIDVTLALDAHQVRLSVCDNGRGYHVPADFRLLGANRHFGLLGMAERAESIGAHIHIESYPGKPDPTCVKVVAPRNAPQWQTASFALSP